MKDKCQKLVLPCFFFLVNFSLFLEKGAAQIVPDSTLPVNSIVLPQGNTNLIEGGTRAGGNLFHSFEEFSVPTGGTAFFNNALDIQNIFSRVTGRSISNIDGLIKANGVANLFLLNPNGIIFGPNARLNIGGSFLATTANSINFADGTQFSAKTPQSTPLLTVSVPVGLQYGGTAGSIVNQARETDVDRESLGLQVQPGNTLALVGGNVNLDGGNLLAPGGRIELGGIAGEGIIGLNIDGNSLSLSFPEIGERSDVSFTNGAFADVVSGGNGSIAINVRNLDMASESFLIAGIGKDLGFDGSKAGNIDVNATGAITLTNSYIRNNISGNATGIGGDINIKASSLSLTDAQLDGGTFGKGNAGNIRLFIDGAAYLDNSRIFSDVQQNAMGNGGTIEIQTGSLTLINGAQIISETTGEGNAGNIQVIATKSFSISDGAKLENSTFGEGDAGNITVEAQEIAIANSEIFSDTSGAGNAGNILLQAEGLLNISNGYITSEVVSKNQETPAGNGGTITFKAGSIFLTNETKLSTNSGFDSGAPGNISIEGREQVSIVNSSLASTSNNNDPAANTSTISILAPEGSIFFDKADISTTNSGIGFAGDIIINARDRVSIVNQSTISSEGDTGYILIGKSEYSGETYSPKSVIIDSSKLTTSNVATDLDNASINATTDDTINTVSEEDEATRINAGLIAIDAIDSISITNSSELNAITNRQGDAGLVLLQAKKGKISISASKIQSIVEKKAEGDGGGIVIVTGSLALSDGAYLDAATFGKGKAGIVVIAATDRISLDGASAVYSTVEENASGDAGGIVISTGLLSLTNGSKLTVEAISGTNKAGNIIAEAKSILLDDRAFIKADTRGGEGNIILGAPSLILRRGSSITTNAQGSNVVGGNITLDTDILAVLEDSNIRANSDEFRGGRVIINSQGFFSSSKNQITATGAGGNPELNGVVEINTPNVDPSSGLVELPQNPVDATRLVASACRSRGSESSQFIITGKGGLPPNPLDAIGDEATWIDLRPRVAGQGEQSSSRENRSSVTTSSVQIVEAQGWTINSKGQVELVAKAPTATFHPLSFTSQECYEPK